MLLPFGPERAQELGRRLADAFGSLLAAISAKPRELERVIGNRPEIVRHLGAVHCALKASARAEALQGEQLGGLAALAHYLRLDLGFEPAETVRVLFLSAQNRLLADETIGRGSASVAPISIRPIIHRALDLGASGLVLVHNHPSGNPEPSGQDVEVTRALLGACRQLDIQLCDHIIVARGGWASLRACGLF